MNTPPRQSSPRLRNGTLVDELRLIRRILNTMHIPWALSGSMATKLHANRLGIPLHRQPNDIDIVIRPVNYESVVRALSTIGYTTNRAPSLRFHHTKLYHGNRFSIDLLAADTNLAPNIRSNNVTLINKTPVVKIRHLINKKNSILRGFLTKVEKNIAEGNKQFLTRLTRQA